jgi:beta-lactamase class A
MGKRNLLILLLLIIILPAGTFFSYRYYRSYKENQRNKLILEIRKANWLKLKQNLTNEVAKFKGEAGIIIKDLEMDWEISFNKDKLFPSASMAKIPIMAACFLAAEESRLKLSQNIKLKPSDKLSGSGILKTTYSDTEYSVEELIGLMIYESDNTATHILTNKLGIDYLNNSFRAFGLKNTQLSRKVADYHARSKGLENYTTAEDMAFILEKIYRRNLVNKDISEKCIGLLKLQRITNRIPKYLPVDIVIVHKSGLERGVCHDAGIVFTRKGDFLICVLTKHKDSNSNPAKEFIAKISLHTYNYFEQLP